MTPGPADAADHLGRWDHGICRASRLAEFGSPSVVKHRINQTHYGAAAGDNRRDNDHDCIAQA